MPYLSGQPIEDIITILDSVNFPVLGLTAGDFETLEAYSIQNPGTLVPVVLDELDEGQYVTSFTPVTAGTWELHYVYRNDPTFQTDTIPHTVEIGSISISYSSGTWTYGGDLTDPSQQVRFLIQDTDSTSPMFTDTEVAYALGSAGNHTRKAAAYLVQRLMARFASMADTTELDLSVRASQLYDHYKDLLTILNSAQAANASVVPYAGGISKADILSNVNNTDRRAGIFDTMNREFWRYR